MLKPPVKTLPDAMQLGRALTLRSKPVTSAGMPALVGLKVGGSTNTLRRAAREFGLIESTPKGFVPTPLMRRLAGETFEPEDLLTALLAPPSYREALARFRPDPSIAPTEDLHALFAEFGAVGDGIPLSANKFLQSVAFARKSGVELDHAAIPREPDAEPADPVLTLPPSAIRPHVSVAMPPKCNQISEMHAESSDVPFVDHELVRAILSLAPNVGSDWAADRREAFIDMLRGAVLSLYPRLDADTYERSGRVRPDERR